MTMIAVLVGFAAGWFAAAQLARRRAASSEAMLARQLTDLQRALGEERARSAEVRAAWGSITLDELAKLGQAASGWGKSVATSTADVAVPPAMRDLETFSGELLEAYERHSAAASAWASRFNALVEGARSTLQRFEGYAMASRKLDKHARELEQAIAANLESLHALRRQLNDGREPVLETADLLARARAEAERGYRAVHEALDEIEATRVLSAGLRSRMEELGRRISSIDGVVVVMTSVAQKTKLLALNASITAAQSGEAGQGFGVVAQEIKTFAKQTASSVEEIVRQIHVLQVETRKVESELGENSVAVDRGLQVALRAGDSLGEIRESHRAAQKRIQSYVRALEEHLHRVDDAQQATTALTELGRRIAGAALELQGVNEDSVQLRSLTVDSGGGGGEAPLDAASATWAREQLQRRVQEMGALVGGLSHRAEVAERCEARARAAEDALSRAAHTARQTTEALRRIARISQA